MVWSPILEVGKYHAPPTSNPPPVFGSPRYYQVTGQKPPKAPKTSTKATAAVQQTSVTGLDDCYYDSMSIDSIEKPILEHRTSKTSGLAKKLGFKK